MDKRKTNHLIGEISPYLLQHAYNPVDWYPWGDDAFNKAKGENKPIFLSIGYSSCHWCHVMEKESFEDNMVAKALNENFISIKVDREERPDVDHLYMSACTSLTGQGGWPLSVFLTPELKPFYAGTYFPKAGFLSILEKISSMWQNDNTDILKQSVYLIEHIEKNEIREKNDASNMPDLAFEQFEKAFDLSYGGFGSSPKFPSPHNLMFLLRYGIQYKKQKAIDMVEKTLDSMYEGGLYDHIGGGFCRYSTDKKWLVPHFEKMMYDNAMLLAIYAEAVSHMNKKYLPIIKGIVDYCKEEMTNEFGAFYTAQDADSEGIEGKYYVWSIKEVAIILGEDADRFCEIYDITLQGNFDGKNIPNLIGKGMTYKDIAFIEKSKLKLLRVRNKRVPPFKDDKILTSSNCLMIAALCIAGISTDNKEYIGYATNAMDFIMDNLVVNGRLMTSFRKGQISAPSSFDDYAYFLWALIELYEATFDYSYLMQAVFYMGEIDKLFWDDLDGGYFISGVDATDLPLRQKSFHDGALPSGNSVMAINLIRLSKLTGNLSHDKKAKKIQGFIQKSYPMGNSMMLISQLFLDNKEVVLVKGEGFDEMLKVVRIFLPFVSILVIDEGYYKPISINAYMGEMKLVDGKTTAYVCTNKACLPAITSSDKLMEVLKI